MVPGEAVGAAWGIVWGLMLPPALRMAWRAWRTLHKPADASVGCTGAAEPANGAGGAPCGAMSPFFDAQAQRVIQACSGDSVAADLTVATVENDRLRALLRALMAERDEVIGEADGCWAPWREMLQVEAWHRQRALEHLTTAQTTIATLEARLARFQRAHGERGRFVKQEERA